MSFVRADFLVLWFFGYVNIHGGSRCIYIMNIRYILPLLLLVFACVMSCGCVADINLDSFFHPDEKNNGDAVLGAFYFTESVYTDRLYEHPNGVTARPGLLFHADNTGIQMWALASGEPVFPLPFTWKNIGDNIYSLTIMNGDGSFFSEELKLSDDGTKLVSLNYAGDGRYIRSDDASVEDSVIGVFSYTEYIYTDFLKDHSDGIMARPGFEFAPDASGVETWVSEEGEYLTSLPFIWENRGNNEYHICVLDATGKTFSEDLTLSADSSELVSHYDMWNGTYLRVK